MKILLSAYACHPNKGSEPSFGWGWLKELAKTHEVWVLSYAGQGQKEAVEKAIRQLPYRDNIHFVPLAVPKLFQHDAFYRIRYEVWQRRAFQTAKKLVRDVNIELIHHVTIASWWNCGHLWKLDIPFVFGPFSGLQAVPSAGYSFLPLRARIYERARSWVLNLSWRLWWRPRQAMRRAKVVLVSNYETEGRVREIRSGEPVIVLSDVGIHCPSQENLDVKGRQPAPALKLLWSGLLIPRKNFGLLLEALSQLPSQVEWQVRVVGDGKLFRYWRKKSAEYGLEDRVTFLGRLRYSSMGEQYRWADVFVFPSLREATGTVILEAMSYGLPVIALNIHGARVVLDESCGILIPVESKNQMVRDFRDAIIKLYRDPELRGKLGEAGRRRAQELFVWEKKAQRMNEIYAQVLGAPLTKDWK